VLGLLIAALGTLFASTLEARDAPIKYEGYFEANAGSTDCGFEKRLFGGPRKNKAILEVTGDEYTLSAKDAAGPITLRGKIGGKSEISTYVQWNLAVSKENIIVGNGKFSGNINGNIFNGTVYSEGQTGNVFGADVYFCGAHFELEKASDKPKTG